VKKPGAVADITLRYKDMVNLGNATARVQVSLPALPRPETGEPIAIFQNVVGFRIGKHLELAAWSVRKGDMSGALRQVGEARGLATATTEADLEMLRSFQSLISRGDWPRDASRKTLLADALEAAGRRKVGTTAR